MSLEIKIVNATIDIFREKGVKFTMDDLANRLGVSKRTLYENIDSKETLLNLLVDEVFDSVTEKGKEVICKSFKFGANNIEKQLSKGMTDEEVKMFKDLLYRALKNMEE